MFKKLLALLCTFMILALPLAGAGNAEAGTDEADFAAFASLPRTIQYQGGVVIRGFVKGADTSSLPLDVAYVMTSSPYVVLGQPTHWALTLSGGDGDYSCEVSLYIQDLAEDSSCLEYQYHDAFYLTGDSFDYTFTTPGRYIWQFHIFDSNGQFLLFQTRPFETCEQSEETQPTTVAGKVNQIVSTMITESMSDYTRALVLHDWLIYNANYDYSYTHYDAAGVLLYGSGVCDSYARAYQMLCTAAGLECIIVTGTATGENGTESHAWNLVKLGGVWYHVDCTWDDPNEGGGYERHTYFCLDDETMAKDHFWNRSDDLVDDGMLPPDAEGGDFSEDVAIGESYDFTFANESEFDKCIDALIDSGCRYRQITGKYVGDDLYGFYKQYDRVAGEKLTELFKKKLISGAGYGFSGYLFSFYLTWNTQPDYIRIAEETLVLSLGDTETVIPSEYVGKDVFSWSSSDTSVVQVTPYYSQKTGPYAVLTAVGTGAATITASAGDSSDSLTVTVLPAFEPDFQLTLTETDSGVSLRWNAIPGVTEYQVMRIHGSSETLLTTVTSPSALLSADQLPDNVIQQVYVIGLRKVGTAVVARYESRLVSYGEMKLDFSHTSLPSGITRIPTELFAGSTSLTSFEVPAKVTVIGPRAFAGCTALTVVSLPASVTEISQDAFDGCPLSYAKVVKDSFAEEWLREQFPDITFIY